MHRRSLLWKAPALGASLFLGARSWAACTDTPINAAPTNATPINVVAEIKALRIPSGPYAGGYELAPNGILNWYFANLGLLCPWCPCWGPMI